MAEKEDAAGSPAPLEEIEAGRREIALRLAQLEAEKAALEREQKALRKLLERVIEHRQKSHTELVILLTTLVSKLPINDVGIIVSRLVEHNSNNNQYLAALLKGTAEAEIPQPVLLRTLEQAKQDLSAAIRPAVQEFLALDPPLEREALEQLASKPELFFSPRMARANRCWIKGQVPRERVIREFGEEALVFFDDMTTDPKLNPRPKPEEIALAFKPEFESLFHERAAGLGEKGSRLMALYRSVQRSRTLEHARPQRIAFQKLSFIIELLHYYQHQNTEPADVIFAQRLPALIEQLVIGGPNDPLDEKLLATAESLLAHVVNPEHRLMIINNMGKASAAGTLLKHVLKLRTEKLPEPDPAVAEFVRHLLPAGQKPPPAQAVLPLVRLLPPEMQRRTAKAVIAHDRVRREDAVALGKALAEALGLQGIEDQIKSQETLPPEVERKMAWARIEDMIVRRADPASVASAMRDRLHAKYDPDEMKQSWLVLTKADPMSFIRIFCQLPYTPDGSTDSVARAAMETYVTRLTHEKYAGTYAKVLTSLKNMFRAKPDSPTLLNFMALVRWVDPEAATKIAADVGMEVHA